MENNKDGYPFEISSYNDMILRLSIESLAYQQASISNIIEMLNLSDEQKSELINNINSSLPLLKENIIQQLYSSFGKTPDV